MEATALIFETLDTDAKKHKKFKILPAFPGTEEFQDANSFCTDAYRSYGILAPKEEFSAKPRIYFYNKYGTLGVFADDPLPLAEVFDFHLPPESFECGRFALSRELKDDEKKELIKNLAIAMAKFFIASILTGRKFYIETHKITYRAVSQVMAEYDKNFLIPIKGAKIIQEKIPEKSRYFYEKMDPQLYEIDMNALLSTVVLEYVEEYVEEI